MGARGGARERAREGALDVDGRPSTWRVDGEGPALVLAHGAGASMTSDFMELATEGLVARGLSVARFHFPYMHRMATEGGRRPPERAPVLLATWRAALTALEGTGALSAPACIGGKSLGGRMASLLLAEGGPETESVAGAVYLGFPLHPPGKVGVERAAHLGDVGRPQLFVSGDRDPLADWGRLGAVLEGLERAELCAVPGGDHSLKVKGGVGWSGAEAWLDAIESFVRRAAGA